MHVSIGKCFTLCRFIVRTKSIVEILESESDRENPGNKYNQVDIKVRDANNRLILIEVQYPSEKVAYDRHLKALRREASLYQSSYVLGEQKGEQKKANEGALNLIRMNALSDEQIAQAIGLSTEEVAQLRQTITDEGS
jgi:hypothetical protein